MTHPTLKKTHKGYYEWIQALIQKEDLTRWAKETPNNPLPKYEKTELKSNKVSVFCLGKEIIKYITI